MKDFLNMKDKVVCVIGGTGLIGTELANAFDGYGAKVFVGTRVPENFRNKSNINYIKIDITSSQSIRRFISDVIVHDKKIDVWINCAWPRQDNSKGRIEDVDPDIVGRDTMDHLLGFYRCCKEILINMKKAKHGVIINFSSTYGDLSPDFRIYKNTEIASLPSYPLIKGGINTFTKYLACYAAPFNIRVNAICPGGVLDKHSRLFQEQYSTRVPLRRMADKKDIVGPVLFLASESASYITGHLLYVDGGLHAW
ncbi:MAG: SDR family oxidoreductase [Candidatus Omnitrophota bacterium]|nr:SDR family oxidoreductase [Candidatus Omnitrophota bacterium]